MTNGQISNKQITDRQMTNRQIIEDTLSKGRKYIAENDAYEIFRSYSVTLPHSVFVRDVSQLDTLCASFPFPAVIKIVSPQILHKSDVGGVVTGIGDMEQLKSACSRMLHTVYEKAGPVQVDGILVNSMAGRGVEVAAGGLRNDQFGPVVMFGLGGIYIEVFKDAAFRLAPLSRDEALRQIKQTRAYGILKGVRGSASCDIEALADLLVSVGRLLCDEPLIKEIDMNPVIAYPEGYCAVDARIIV